MGSGNLSPERQSAREVIDRLGLERLEPEGGYYRRITEAVSTGQDTNQRAWSVIYYLVTPEGFSALHRIKADEIWNLIAGDPLEMLQLEPDGGGRLIRLGLDPAAGELPVTVVPAQILQGTRLVPGGRWALVSCVVVPEFVWREFELGERDALLKSHPQFADSIIALTRPPESAP